MLKKSIYLILFISFLFVTFLIIRTTSYYIDDLKGAIEDGNNSNGVLRKNNDSLKKTNESLSRELLIYNNTYNGVDDFFLDTEEGFIGIKKPKKYLEDALCKRPELIPCKGVLGGKMFFSNAQTNGNGWIIGNYEDGHIGGEAIYTYKLTKNKKVQFTLLYYRNNQAK
jgi:hypothetical protein